MGTYKFTNRLYTIIPEEFADEANQLASEITGDQADLNTFTIPLSTDGGLPASHYGSNTGLTEGMRKKAREALESLPSVIYALLDNYKLELTATNSDGLYLGEVVQFNQLLKVNGLELASDTEVE